MVKTFTLFVALLAAAFVASRPITLGDLESAIISVPSLTALTGFRTGAAQATAAPGDDSSSAATDGTVFNSPDAIAD
jgi:hypothetical protein